MTGETIDVAPVQTVARPAAIAALVAGAALVLKVLVILASVNTAPVALTTALYVLGVFAPVVVAIDMGRRRASLPARIAVAVGIVFAQLFYVMVLSDVVELLVAPFTETPYMLDEVPLAVLGVIWLIVGLRLLRGRS